MKIVSHVLLALLVAVVFVGCNGAQKANNGSSTSSHGDFEQRLKQLESKHNTDIATRDKRIAELESRLNQVASQTGQPVASGGSGIECGSNGTLRVDHSGPQSVVANSTATYTVKVANPYSCPAYRVTVASILSVLQAAASSILSSGPSSGT